MENTLGRINRLDIAEEKFRELKAKTIETLQNEKNLNRKNISEMWDNLQNLNMLVIGSQKGKKQSSKKYLKK